MQSDSWALSYFPVASNSVLTRLGKSLHVRSVSPKMSHPHPPQQSSRLLELSGRRTSARAHENLHSDAEQTTIWMINQT